MSKYIELIDKYMIFQNSDGDGYYNPPSYIWDDNTGELVRCSDCEHWQGGDVTFDCPWDMDLNDAPTEHDYCSRGVRKK